MKDLRRDYTKSKLDESMVNPDPITQFDLWFKEAQEFGELEPNAMVLSTSVENSVNSRTVLLKGIEDGSFHFYTNYTSSKGSELEANNQCSLLFPWYPLERQVIIRGKAVKVSEETSDEYFLSRPYESQLGAWVSNQSEPIKSRQALESRYQEVKGRFDGSKMERPPHWGGFAIEPTQIEFWQGRQNRLHDRISYSKQDGIWHISRLQP